jgi:hypothetical protein
MLPNFLNMLSWWQWAILAAVPPAIVLLYFLKLKRRPLEVPSTFLWRKSTEDLHVNTIWQRLRRNLLLFLQLLVLALAAGALLRPSWEGAKLVGSRFIFLVDNSASMSATDVEPSRLDEAKRQVGEAIDLMQSGDVAMLISFSDSARVEQGFTDDRRQLHRALEGIQPASRGTSLLEALKLAAGLANPGREAGSSGESGEGDSPISADAKTGTVPMPAALYIFSDGRFGPVAGFALGHLNTKFIPIGSPSARNVAITAFSVRRNESNPDRLQAFARLENFGPQPAKVSLKLFRDGRMIDADEVEVTPKESRGIGFNLKAVTSGVLMLKTAAGRGKGDRHLLCEAPEGPFRQKVPVTFSASDDQLALDDTAYTVINPPRRCQVLLVTPGNEPLQMALKTSEAAQIAQLRIEAPDFLKTKTYIDQATSGVWQLVIYDRCRPERMPTANTLFVGSIPPEMGWSAGAKTGSPQIIDVETAHPLLQWIDLGDVLVGEATPLGVPRAGRVLVDSDAGPLLALTPRDAFEDIVLGFVILDESSEPGGKKERFMGTNWMIRPSFPVFVLNLLNYAGVGRRALDEGSVRPGAPVSLESASPLQIRTPGGRTVDIQARSGRATLSDTGEQGVYEVRSDGKTVRQFAVNLFDPTESDIRPETAPAIKIGDVTITGDTTWEAARWEIWKYLAATGLVVLLLEWYIYIRRVY